MGKRILDELKKWSLGEIIFYSIIFLISVVALPIVASRFNFNVWHVMFALFAILSIILVFKKTFVGYCMAIVSIILYCPFAFNNNIYSDLIVALFLLPFIIVELIRWIKKKTNKPKPLAKNAFIIELVTTIILMGVLFYGSYNLLYTINNVWRLGSAIAICCAALFLYLTTYADRYFSVFALAGYFGLATTNWVFCAIYTSVSYASFGYIFLIAMIIAIRMFIVKLIAFIRAIKHSKNQENDNAELADDKVKEEVVKKQRSAKKVKGQNEDKPQKTNKNKTQKKIENKTKK